MSYSTPVNRNQPLVGFNGHKTPPRVPERSMAQGRYYCARANMAFAQQSHEKAMHHFASAGARIPSASSQVIFCTRQIRDLIEVGKVKEAFQVFTKMKQNGLKPDIITYNTLINGYGKLKKCKKALFLFEEMQKEGMKPDQYTYRSLFFASLGGNDVSITLPFFYKIQQAGRADPKLYNIIISVCARAAELTTALSLFDQMQEEGMVADQATYNGLINACARVVSLGKALSKADQSEYGSLIKKCARFNALEKAVSLFYEMKEAKIEVEPAIYTTLIIACVRDNDLPEAFSLFQDMKQAGMDPDMMIYNHLISGCVRVYDLGSALALFEEMQKNGIRPTPQTYRMLIDGYVKMNDVSHALSMIKKMREARFLDHNILLQRMFDDWMKDKVNLETLKILYTTLSGVHFFKPEEGSETMTLNCQTLTHGCACLHIGIHLDVLPAPFKVEVLVTNETMNKAIREFVNEHYPSWAVQESHHHQSITLTH